MSPLLPAVPSPLRLWRVLRFWIHAAYAWVLAAAVPALAVRYWFMDGVGHAGVFWTNFSVQAALFTGGLVVFAAAVIWPVRAYAGSPALRAGIVHVGVWVGIFAGWLCA